MTPFHLHNKRGFEKKLPHPHHQPVTSPFDRPASRSPPTLSPNPRRTPSIPQKTPLALPPSPPTHHQDVCISPFSSSSNASLLALPNPTRRPRPAWLEPPSLLSHVPSTQLKEKPQAIYSTVCGGDKEVPSLSCVSTALLGVEENLVGRGTVAMLSMGRFTREIVA